MKKLLVIIILISLFLSSCGWMVELPFLGDPKKESVVVMGDSWGYFSEQLYGSYTKAIRDVELNNRLEVFDFDFSGMTADGLLTDNAVNAIRAYFLTSPDIKYIILSIGGNDFIDGLKKDLDPDEVIVDIALKSTKVAILVKTLRPKAKVIIMGYDYLNLEYNKSEVNLLTNEIYKLWKSTGERSTFEINTLIAKFNERMIRSTEYIDGVYYSNNLGLMQHSEDNSLPIPGNYPDYDPMIGGDINKATPNKYMKHRDGLIDAIHLNKEGYDIVAKRLVETFIVPDYNPFRVLF